MSREIITTKEKYDRVMQVFRTGRKHDGSRADVEQVGDIMVAMHDPKKPNFPRQVQLRHVEDYTYRKGFVVGWADTKPAPKKRQTKAQIEKEREILEKEAGGKAKGALASKE